MQNNKKNSDISSFLMAHEEKKKHLTFNYTQKKKRGRNTFHALNIQKNDRINSCGKQAGIHKI